MRRAVFPSWVNGQKKRRLRWSIEKEGRRGERKGGGLGLQTREDGRDSEAEGGRGGKSADLSIYRKMGKRASDATWASKRSEFEGSAAQFRDEMFGGAQLSS